MPRLVQHHLQIAHGVLGEVKNRRRKRRIGAAVDEDLGEMFERSRAARCDHRNRHGARDGRGQLAIEPALCAVAIDRRQQDLTRAAIGGLLRPLDRFALGARLAAARVHDRFAVDPLRVDRDDRRLAAVPGRKLRDERGIGQRGRVQADFLGSSVDGRRRIFLRPDAAADRQRNEDALRHGRDGCGERAPPLDRRGDVEDDDLVDPFLVIAFGELRRIAGVAQPLEIDALDDLPVAHVEARDDPFRQHC